MASRRRPDFERLIAAVARELDSRALPFMLIGGQAVLVHAEPRLTQDIDVTLGASPDRLQDVLDTCAALDLRVLPDNIEAFARKTFVVPAAETETGIRIDFIFSTTPYEANAIGRAVLVPVVGRPVPFAAAEDLVLHKLFAGRPRDIEDAKSVVRRKGDQLDWEYLERWARAFAEIPGRENMPEEIDQLRSDVRKPGSTL
ncbi:MAG: nucleotidyl transferase AbiEii/AbiGii toxin family protein [Longimicrobiales bacterium]